MKIDRFLGFYNENEHKIIAIFGIKLKIKNTKKQIKILNRQVEELSYRLLNLEMEVVKKSGLWDARYYIKNYHPEMRKHEALIHYMTEGFKHKEKPSEILDVDHYANETNFINPILDLLSRGRYQYTRIFFENKYPVSDEVIKTYRLQKSKRKSKKVMYTCITNNYDHLEDLKGFIYTDPEWDYIAFTDNEEHIKQGQVGIWDIRPLVYQELSAPRNNRWHKLHPHILFPEYEESVYIDADINILTPKFFNIIKNTDKNILLPIHADRVDLYKEILWANEMGFDKKEISEAQYKMIKDAGFPENYGMPENNIIYRKHHLPEIINMMDEWWFFVKNYSQRDQTSLAFIMWRYGKKIEDHTFENTRIDYKNYCIYKHRKRYAV